MPPDPTDQTEGDVVTGIGVTTDGYLVFRRRDGSELTYSLTQQLPTEDQEVQGSLWTDEGLVKMSFSFIEILPTEDPEVVGALWNDDGVIRLSAGP